MQLTPLSRAAHLTRLGLIIAGCAIWSSLSLAQSSVLQDTLESEADDVQRLKTILREHYATEESVRASRKTLDESEETAEPGSEATAAEEPEVVTFSVDQVLLNGAEANVALAQFSQRLQNPTLPASRRDVAPICIIETRLFETLVHSERRSLKPVGKHQFIASTKIQAGTTELAIKSQKWQLDLPDGTPTKPYFILLYYPPVGTPELHVFAVDDLRAQPDLQTPEWLPRELAQVLEQE